MNAVRRHAPVASSNVQIQNVGSASLMGTDIEGSGSSIKMNNPTVTLSFYSNVPNFELSLDEFEEFALSRLKILRKIEDLKSRNITGIKFRDALDAVIKEEELLSLSSTAVLSDSDVARGQQRQQQQQPPRLKKDIASHFILRAAYCHSEELRRWFLQHECDLFRHRLDKLVIDSFAFQAFLDRESLHFDEVDRQQKEERKDMLMSCHSGTVDGAGGHILSLEDFRSMTFFKIPFVQALDLVKMRLVYVEGGFAYVPMPRLVSIITAKFRTNLSKSLVHGSNAFHRIAENSRIGPLLKSMNRQYTGKDFTDSIHTGAINSHNVDDMAERSMPLCMREIHMGLKRDHKLKHWGRLQYGLFLKGAGMTMEESMIFFQREFTKIMTAEQFNKQYSYNIRHMYGKEGKRAHYTPYNCRKIIMGNPPATGDHHGCPFKHYDEVHLSSLLTKMRISHADQRPVLENKRKKNEEGACQALFKAMHPGAAAKPDVDLSHVGQHPSGWFEASSAYHGSHENGAAMGDGFLESMGESSSTITPKI